MKRLQWMSVAAFAGVVISSASLGAQTCGGSAFQTCASVSISATDLGGGVTKIVMSVTNLSGLNGTYANTVFTSMGLQGLGAFSYVSGSLVVTGQPSGNWALGTPGLNGAGIVQNTSGFSPTSPTVPHGLAAGQSGTFEFRITGVTFASIDTRDWAIHGQNGPADLSAPGTTCSTKLVVSNGVANAGPYSANCEGISPVTGQSVAPEPASLVLLGSGLIGIAGVVSRRRKSA